LYYGKISSKDQRSIDAHNETIKNLQGQQREELKVLAQENEELTAAAAAATTVLIAQGLTERQALRQQLEYAVVAFEMLLLLCLSFSWWYYDNCRQERLGLAETAAVEGETAAVVPLVTPAITAAVTAAVQGGEAAPILSQKKIGFVDYEAPKTTEENGSSTREKELEYTRKCPVCETGFIHNSWNHTYCTEACKITAWEQRTGKTYTGRTSNKA